MVTLEVTLTGGPIWGGVCPLEASWDIWPAPVEAAGSSLLYSREFYGVAKRRLKSGGILQQWLPEADSETLRAVTASLLDSFPYVEVFRQVDGIGHHFLASMGPFEVPSASEFVKKMPAAARKDLAEWLGTGADLEAFMELVLSRRLPEPRRDNWKDAPRITDDRPFNEYYLLRRHGQGIQTVFSGTGYGA